MTTKTSADASWRDGIVLGLLTALGPFAIDMYLPALPAVGASFDINADAALRSLTAYPITFAFGQMVFGTLSDPIGRKPPLYTGVLLFIFGSIGCALATTLPALAVLRAIEGLGGAAGMVMARASVRDLHSGSSKVRLLSILNLVFSVSPVLAPLAGSLILDFGSWRDLFWLIAILGTGGLVLAALFLPETSPLQVRGNRPRHSVLAATRRLLTDRGFLSASLVGTFGVAGFFVFLANSSFVFMGHYGLTARGYSLTFGVNAITFFAGMQLSGRLTERWGLRQVVVRALAASATVLAIRTVLVYRGIDALGVLVAMLFAAFAFVGLMIPAVSVLALAEHGNLAGTAASLMNTLQLVSGTAIMAVSGLFADGTPLPLVVGISACALVASLRAFATIKTRVDAHA